MKKLPKFNRPKPWPEPKRSSVEDEKMELRPSVRKFAELMELKLRGNDYKGGWEGCSTQYLWDRLNDEMDELDEALGEFDCSKNKTKKIAMESADVANFAMMIADNFGKL